jgi:glucosamine kinase
MSGSAQDLVEVTGVDVGATKTELARALDGVVTAQQIVSTPTWRTRSVAMDAKALAGLVFDAFGEEAASQPLAVGAHGCDSTAQCHQLELELAQHFTGPLKVVNDAELMPWAMGVTDGIGVVVGTGSIAVSRNDNGELLTAGGWGWLLGDEGSAAGLVREACRAVLARLDDGAGLDRLGERLLSAFKVTDGPQLAMALSRDSSAHRWGSYAPEIFLAADEGSGQAQRVIEAAGEKLAGWVAQLRARGVPSEQVVAGGAVIVSQPRLRAAFAEALAAVQPGVELSILDHPPVRGALALARSVAEAAAAA